MSEEEIEAKRIADEAEAEKAAKLAEAKRIADKAKAEKAALKPMRVKFLKGWGVYNAGEIATFPTSRAEFFFKQKIAEKA